MGYLLLILFLLCSVYPLCWLLVLITGVSSSLVRSVLPNYFACYESLVLYLISLYLRLQVIVLTARLADFWAMSRSCKFKP